MEQVSAATFILLSIVGVVQFIKYLAPKVNGAVTIGVAVLVGALASVFDTQIGIPPITFAQGIVLAFGAVGLTATASKVGVALKSDV